MCIIKVHRFLRKEVMDMKRRRALKQFRRVQRNLLRDRQVMEDLLDEMASKWAMKAEALRSKTSTVQISKRPN